MILQGAFLGQRPADEVFENLQTMSLPSMMAAAEELTLGHHGPVVTYSRKVFIPLTRLCRDICHYCTFATTPSRVPHPYLSREQILEIARAGVRAGCREALFTLGDRPEARYAKARQALLAAGHTTTLEYLREMCAAVLVETSLLPHINAGVMDTADYAALRPHSVSMGLMLESTSLALCEKGGPHFGSPDKLPARRLASIEAAGQARVPFTTGLLIGIGETRCDRIEALTAIRDLHGRYGHIQEVIIQNFRPKPGTRMAWRPAPSLEEHLWTIAAARLILGGAMSIQAPPNLQPDAIVNMVRAGINDWGGVSPVTPDHVNPEAPWPHIQSLELDTLAAGRILRERLAVGPEFALDAGTWVDPALAPRVLRLIDGRGLPKTDDWNAGRSDGVPKFDTFPSPWDPRARKALARAEAGFQLTEREIVALFGADGDDLTAVMKAANLLRQRTVGDDITYAINRNVNYTNICLYKCGFCAFSKGSNKAARGLAYRLDFDEIGRRAAEAWERGATEVCLQGGIHPDFDGTTYLAVLDAVKAAAPDIHIHAFSPLEVTHGARTLKLSLLDYLQSLKSSGLSSLPGTAAEILDPDVRAGICPDKITAEEWLDVMRTAHGMGLRSTATIMFGHIDRYYHWARHLLAIRALQQETGGFTEFVPLPFVHVEAPIWRKGRARSGPSYREVVLMHSISRIVLHPVIPNIQVSWVKMGAKGASAILNAGANDLGGTLMNESITRAAGGLHGQEMGEAELRTLIESIGRSARQRTTLYGSVAKLEAIHAE